MSELLPTYVDRPAVVAHAGGRVYISTHDAEYLRMRAEWKHRLAEAHPDSSSGHGSELRFHRVIRQRDRWEAAERVWYAQYGLQPPVPARPPSLAAAPSELLALLPLRRGPCVVPMEQVQAYLRVYPHSTAREMSQALGITLSQAFRARRRAVKASPVPAQSGEDSTNLRKVLKVLLDGRYHVPSEIRAALGVERVGVYISRLRYRGFDIRCDPAAITGLGHRAYRLIAPPQQKKETV